MRRPKEVPPKSTMPGSGGVAAHNDSPLVQALRAQAIGHHFTAADEQLKHILETLQEHREHRKHVTNLVTNHMTKLGLREAKPKDRMLGPNLASIRRAGPGGKEAIQDIYERLEEMVNSKEDSDYMSAQSEAEGDYDTADQGITAALEEVNAAISMRFTK